MKIVTAIASLLLLTSTLTAAPFDWPNPINADVYGLAGPVPQSFSIYWSGNQYHWIAPGGAWDLTITPDADSGFYPISLLDPPAEMTVTAADSSLLASFDVYFDHSQHDLIYTVRTFAADPSTDVKIKSRGLTPEPTLLAPILLGLIALLKRN